MLNRARGERHPCWKGGVNRHANGYVLLMRKDHPRANRDGYVMEHILVAESAIGFYLPVGAEVHHVNGIRHENANTNLVICENHTYHLLLHQRARAFKETGNPSALRCRFCKRWETEAISGMIYGRTCRAYAHRSCENANQMERYRKRKAIAQGTR